MPGLFFRKYATTLDATTAGSIKVRLSIRKAGSADFAASGDWTPATGDVKVSIDGAAQANVGTLPAYSNGAWEFVLSGSELTGKSVNVNVVDSATKAVDDDGFIVETYGNASAMYPTNFVDAVRMGLTALPNANAGANGGLPLGDANSRVDVGRILSQAPTLDAGNAIQVGANVITSGTAQAGSSTTITLAAGDSSTNNYYRGCIVQTIGGTGAGQSRNISSYVGASRAATVDQSWMTNPDATTVYRVIAADAAFVNSSGQVTLQPNSVSSTEFTQTAADKVWSSAARSLTDKIGFALSAAGVQAIWDALTSALTTVGSIGKRIVDNLTGDAFARLGAPAGASVSADIAANLTAIGTRLATSSYTTPPTVAQIDTQLTGTHGAGSWQTGSGGGGGGFTGSRAVTLTFRDAGGAAVPNVVFSVAGVGTGATDGTGTITIGLNDGSYTVVATPTSGVLWTSQAITVSSIATSFSITGQAVSIPPAAGATQVSGTMTAFDTRGNTAVANVEFELLSSSNAGSFSRQSFTGTSNAGGGLLVESFEQSSLYRARRLESDGKPGAWTIPFTTPTNATPFALPQTLGRLSDT